MRAGKLNKRISIQKATYQQDEVGQAIPTWTTEATRWGSITPLNGRELEVAKKINAEITHKITLRHYPGLTTKDRLLFNGRQFEIVSVINPEEANIETVIMATEAV
jgi:SPP1 family predicted phage head-tail adaptor